MSGVGASPIAPSTKLALYLAAVITVYLIPSPAFAIGIAVALLMAAAMILRTAYHPVPRARWRAIVVFVAWVFIMRLALDLVTGVPLADTGMWLAAGRQAARVSVLAVGVVVLIAVTRARDVVDELESSRLPRTGRLLLMMLVQYPRVLRDRYEQIVEAQVARGAERPKSIAQRVAHGAALLLPVMQSELNAVGERAALIHLRGLDLDVGERVEAARGGRDLALLFGALIIVIAALALRLAGR